MAAKVLQAAKMGIWTIEIEPDGQSRLYADDVLLELFGLTGRPSPEECFQHWYQNIEPSYRYAVDDALRRIVEGEVVETQYLWRHPERGWRYVRCGGQREPGDAAAIRLNGYHQDVTGRVSVQREKEWLEQLYSDVTQSLGILFDGILRLQLQENTVLVVQSAAFPEKIGRTMPLDRYIKMLQPFFAGKELGRLAELMKRETLLRLRAEGRDRFTQECPVKGTQGKGWYAFTVLLDDRRAAPDHVVVAVQDISRQKHSEAQTHRTLQTLRYHAQRDPLTGLYNRAAVQEYVDGYLETQPPEELSALLLVDLDNFKSVNDTLGHLKGDQVLCEVADLLRHGFRENDIIGRIGGDEFVVFLGNIKTAENAEHSAQKLAGWLQRTYSGPQGSVTIGGSVGIALAPARGSSFQQLYHGADQALYQVKGRTKNGVALYQND